MLTSGGDAQDAADDVLLRVLRQAPLGAHGQEVVDADEVRHHALRTKVNGSVFVSEFEQKTSSPCQCLR